MYNRKTGDALILAISNFSILGLWQLPDATMFSGVIISMPLGGFLFTRPMRYTNIVVGVYVNVNVCYPQEDCSICMKDEGG